MTYPEPAETDLEQYIEGLEDQQGSPEGEWVKDLAGEPAFIPDVQSDPVPEVALEDGGPSEDFMYAIHGLERNDFRNQIWREVLDERVRQLRKWGDQTRPLGSSGAWKQIADIHRNNCDQAEADGECTWRHITLEETFEAFAETERDAFRKEAVQTIAVYVSALEDLYRDEFPS